jgi:DNA topoisomerase-1
MFPERADGTDPRICPSCGNGRLNLKLGRFGAFIGCSNYPECRYTRQLGREGANGVEPKSLGTDPKTGLEVALKSGRFGPYVQLGEVKKDEKPPRAGIPKGFAPEGIDLSKALQLLSLPREIGLHPETGHPINAAFGRFGPYIKHDGAFASLDSPEEVFTVGINRAVTLLAERKARGPSRHGPQALKELGKNETGDTIKVMKGRYGAYVTDGSVNATLPNGCDPMGVTLDEAKALIAAREAKGGGKKQKKKGAAKKTAEAKAPKKTAKKAKPAIAVGETEKPKRKSRAAG